jgi:predicted AlkP superfamily pyrophosphatase or phosphodiesterase
MSGHKTTLPDYSGGSIVNLMSSVLRASGAPSLYRPLSLLPPHELKRFKNIVLVVIDGMGYEFLIKNGAGTIFLENLRGPITSVFPATTATAITTFNTGLAPQQHGITGWFMYLKELGTAVTILPFIPRFGGAPFSREKVDPRRIFNKKPVFDQVDAEPYAITPDELLDSDYTIVMSGRARRIGYKSLQDFFDSIMSAISSPGSKKYIYAYWPILDSLCHRHGTRHREVLLHFKELADHFTHFSRSIIGTHTIAIITADHGIIDTDPEHTITVNEHEELLQTLTLPVCGEPRVAYCYVHPDRTSRFERYIERHFKNACSMHKGEDLVRKRYFGLHRPGRELADRIGDYILIMKEAWVMRHFVLGEPQHYFTGNHGGTSRDEMLVPLTVCTV